MTNKKITVVGDGAEQPLTPEEEHRLEVRVDQMLDPNVPDTAPDPQQEPAAEPQPVAAPKVTKIVTKFADDEGAPAAPAPKRKADKPKPAAPAEPPEVPAEESPEPVKPATKKIAIKHHDETEDPLPKKPAKVKAPAKKAAKKLKITVDGEPASDDLASKADAITAAALAAEQQLATTPEATPEPLTSEAPAEDAPQETPDEVTAPESATDSELGAPPLILKHSAAPIGTDDTEAAETEEEPASPAAAPVGKKITVLHADTQPDADDSEAIDAPSLADTDTVPSEPVPAEPVVEVEVEEIPEPAEEIAVTVEPEAPEPTKPEPVKTVEPIGQPASLERDADAKKYRPPEGPIQFKRADVPIQPKKPGEPRQEEQQAELQSEDAAIAKAFETKSDSKGDTTRVLVGGLLKVLKWTVILAAVAAIVAVGALPTLRHKALKLVGLDKTGKPATALTTAPAAGNAAVSSQPVGTDVYAARRAGVYNLYTNEVGGQREKLLLAGTGKESGTGMALSTNPANRIAAFVSTRDGKANSAGDYQQSLTLIDIASGAVTTADTADSIKLVNWFGNILVYVTSSATTSTTDTNRYQIVAYNTSTKKRLVLDHTNYLNDILAARGTLYYATAASSANSGEFVKIQPDGTSKQVVLSSEVAAINRTDYNTLVLSGVSKWYSYALGSTQATQTNNVSQADSRLYIDSPDGKQSVYINAAKQLVLYDAQTGKEKTLLTSGANYPMHWIHSTTLAYRSDTSDYAIAVAGTTPPAKITDVYDVSSISLWHEQ